MEQDVEETADVRTHCQEFVSDGRQSTVGANSYCMPDNVRWFR